MRGLNPAPVTPFTPAGDIDYEAIHRLGSWLGGINGVKGLVVLGHAGEGTFLTPEEQVSVIKAFTKSVEYQDGRGLFPEVQEFLANFSNEAKQKVLRKVRDMES